MIGRVETSDDGVMIGESQCRKHRDQTGLGFGSVGDQTVNIGGGGLELVAKSKTIGGNQENHRAIELL